MNTYDTKRMAGDTSRIGSLAVNARVCILTRVYHIAFVECY